MARRGMVWKVVAGTFTVGNVLGAAYAAVLGEQMHAGVHVILTGLTLYWMRRYVLFSPHIQNPEISKREIRGSTIRTMVPVVCALIAIPLSFQNINLALTLLTLAVIFNLSSYSTRILERIMKAIYHALFGEDVHGHFAD